MTIKRLWWILGSASCRGGRRRANYARKHGIYANIGENVSIQSRLIPVYSELIYFHNNISVARNVDFVTHDIAHVVMNRLPKKIDRVKLKEKIGCIEIMDNVFIGSNSVILYDTRIGPNVIIGSGSVVTRDCEPNSVYAGVPAKKIGSFDDFVERRIEAERNGLTATTEHNQHLSQEEINNAWNMFKQQHDS